MALINQEARKDFFISYSSFDRVWAEWIAHTLEKHQFSVTIQAWHFLPGSNFVLEMQRAAVECNRTIAVLSSNWLESVFAQPEWAAAFAMDPTGTGRKLIPVRVAICEPPGLLKSIIYCDLVGLNEADARKALVRAVQAAPSRPDYVSFPPGAALGSTTQDQTDMNTEYPGSGAPVQHGALSLLLVSAVGLIGLLETTRKTFEAQARIRDQLVASVEDRLNLISGERTAYESFFMAHFSELNLDEKRVFHTIRSFTIKILREYNHRMLTIIDGCSQLKLQIPSISRLEIHLRIWLAKFDGAFMATPGMCLLYVGVEEGVPFPSEAEREVWLFIHKHPEANDFVGSTPPENLDYYEESSTAAVDEQRAIAEYHNERETRESRVREIRARLNRINNRVEYVPFNQLPETLYALDRELGALFSTGVHPGMPLDQMIPPEVIQAVRVLLELRNNAWPQEFISSLVIAEAAMPVDGLTKPEFRWQNRDLLTELPVLAYYVKQFGIASDLPRIWEEARRKLSHWFAGE